MVASDPSQPLEGTDHKAKGPSVTPVDGEEPAEEGGYVLAASGGRSGRSKEPITFEETKHRADTARLLAYALVAILGGSFGLHYMIMFVAVCYGLQKTAEAMTTLFGAWLPAISSLVSSAVTYYFTKESGSSKGR